jgi:hypothetical protein
MRRPARSTLTIAAAALVAVGAAVYLAVALLSPGSGSSRTYVHHPLPPGVRASDVHTLGRGAFRDGDFFAGITSTSGDAPGDPWVRLALSDNGAHQGDDYTVHAGQSVKVGRYTVRFIDVIPGEDRHVTFTLTGPPAPPAPSPTSPSPTSPSPTSASPTFADSGPGSAEDGPH